MSKSSTQAVLTGQAEFVRWFGRLLAVRRGLKPRVVRVVDSSFFEQFS